MGWYKKFYEMKENVIEAFCLFTDKWLVVKDDPNQTEEEKQKERHIKACMLGASGRVTIETKEDQAREAEAKAKENEEKKCE